MKSFTDFDQAFEFFDSIFTDGIKFLNTNPPIPSVFTTDTYPPVNIYFEEDKAMIFEFAVAGIKEDRISLDFKDDYMVFEVSKDEEDDGIKYIKKGIRTSCSKSRYFVPSSKWKQSDAKASLKDGILKVIIPVNPEAAPVRLKIDKE